MSDYIPDLLACFYDANFEIPVVFIARICFVFNLRCEERVLAINEAMMLDSAKPAANVTDDQQGLFERQTQLASLVEGMFKTHHMKATMQAKVKRAILSFVRACIAMRPRYSLQCSLDVSFYVYVQVLQRKTRKEKKAGGMSKSLIDVTGENGYISSPRGIMVSVNVRFCIEFSYLLHQCHHYHYLYHHRRCVVVVVVNIPHYFIGCVFSADQSQC